MKIRLNEEEVREIIKAWAQRVGYSVISVEEIADPNGYEISTDNNPAELPQKVTKKKKTIGEGEEREKASPFDDD